MHNAYPLFSERIFMDQDYKRDHGLFPSEQSILRLIYEGRCFQEIMDELEITIDNLCITIANMMNKLHISEWYQLTAFAWHLATQDQQNTLQQEMIFTEEEMKDLEYLKLAWQKTEGKYH